MTAVEVNPGRCKRGAGLHEMWAGSVGSPSPTPTLTPTGSVRSLPALQLAVLVAVGGHLDYCDPDLYPVGRGTPLENAQARFPTIEADRAAFQAILQHEHLSA